MNRRLVFGLVTALLLLNLAVGAKIYLAAAPAARNDNAAASLGLFSEVLQKIRKEYVDGQNLTYRQLVHAAIKGTVSQLDPHSEFLDADAYRQLQDDTSGEFGGLGLMVGMRDGYVTILSPVEDSPGAHAGILAGDRILKVEGRSVTNRPLTDIVKELRGAPGSTVTLTLTRPSTGVTTDYHLARAVIQMAIVRDINGRKEFPLDANKIGYVYISQFSDHAGSELAAALAKLKQQGMKGLVLDLRWNPGGLLDQAVEVCSQFLARGQPIVSTEGRRNIERYYAIGHGDELDGMPIVVLVNLSSASAAEIVAGCLQDLHRAVILGETTFGKGSVQNIFPLEDQSALKLTVARYYTPSHKVIHQRGITPDVYVPLTDVEEGALRLQRSLGGLAALPEPERALAATIRDEQRERAEDLIQGLLAYRRLSAAEPAAEPAGKSAAK